MCQKHARTKWLAAKASLAPFHKSQLQMRARYLRAKRTRMKKEQARRTAMDRSGKQKRKPPKEKQ